MVRLRGLTENVPECQSALGSLRGVSRRAIRANMWPPAVYVSLPAGRAPNGCPCTAPSASTTSADTGFQLPTNGDRASDEPPSATAAGSASTANATAATRREPTPRRTSTSRLPSILRLLPGSAHQIRSENPYAARRRVWGRSPNQLDRLLERGRATGILHCHR